ncbi:hypothetical protein PRK78_005767 [Emydomyces testavorans]|uniref:Uncharacterized protein n=1 Tax=Emydomyces testavorans TaxID=2070801 RepID=A0AAF0IL00_9EURO|nr:hypothetical protein PRK78_005767 [Emydomyces testavorans]
MTWAEGVPLEELMKNKPSDGQELDPSSVGDTLDLNIDKVLLKSLYKEVAKVLNELWCLDFNSIGSLVFDAALNSWEVNSRPLSITMKNLLLSGGLILHWKKWKKKRKRLSTNMRQSMGDKTLWFNRAILNGWSIDYVYWEFLGKYIYGQATVKERITRTASGELHRGLEMFVKSKIEGLKQYHQQSKRTMKVWNMRNLKRMKV